MATDADRRACQHTWTQWGWFVESTPKHFPNGTWHRNCPKCDAYQLTPDEKALWELKEKTG